tara:strand:+ start:2511 stop:3467 length:957 start_codon:yes stop_codon:yes gene_type:complete
MSNSSKTVRIQWQGQDIIFKSPQWHRKNKVNPRTQGSGRNHMIGNFYEGMALASLPNTKYKIVQTKEFWAFKDKEDNVLTMYYFEEMPSRTIYAPEVELGSYWTTKEIIYPENQYANTDVIWTIENNSTIPISYPPSFTGLPKGHWMPGETITIELHIKSRGATKPGKGCFCSLTTNPYFSVKHLIPSDPSHITHWMEQLEEKYCEYSPGKNIEWLNKNKKILGKYLESRFSNVHVVMRPHITKNGDTWSTGDQWDLFEAPPNLFKNSSFEIEEGQKFIDYSENERQKYNLIFEDGRKLITSFYKPSKNRGWMVQIHF